MLNIRELITIFLSTLLILLIGYLSTKIILKNTEINSLKSDNANLKTENTNLNYKRSVALRESMELENRLKQSQNRTKEIIDINKEKIQTIKNEKINTCEEAMKLGIKYAKEF